MVVRRKRQEKPPSEDDVSLIIIVAAPRWALFPRYVGGSVAKAVVAVLVMAGAVLWKLCGRPSAFDQRVSGDAVARFPSRQGRVAPQGAVP